METYIILFKVGILKIALFIVINLLTDVILYWDLTWCGGYWANPLSSAI